ncbi:MAG: ATP-binding protein [Verrucomicrobiota bacterium]
MNLLFVSPFPPSELHATLSSLFRLTLCPDQLTAIAIAENIRPSFIIIETLLPDGDGFSLTRTFSALPRLATTPVLLLSHQPPTVQLEHMAAESGAATILSRDADAKVVESTLRALIADHNSRCVNSPTGRSTDQLPIEEQNVALRKELAEYQAKLHQLESHLRHAQRLSAIGTISSGVAHDFNNILCGILCLSDIGLRAAQSYPDCYRNFQDIRTATNRASNLVRAIVSFSKRQEQPKGPFYPSEALIESLVMLRATIPSFVEIAETVLAPTATILGEISQFQQILTNLVLNARYAIGNKSGRIEVRIDLRPLSPAHKQQLPHSEDKKLVCLQVIDDGSGIAPEHLEHICEPFFTTKPASQGTGLGLWVTRRIVESWDGMMFIDSKLNEGTTFSIYFPPAPKAAGEIPPPAIEITPHEKQILDPEKEPFAT